MRCAIFTRDVRGMLFLDKVYRHTSTHTQVSKAVAQVRVSWAEVHVALRCVCACVVWVGG